MSDLLIWWTTEADCRAIGDPGGTDEHPDDTPLPPGCPAYIRAEYASRYGRNGRGRLWVPQDIDLEEIPWDDARSICREIMAASAAGIVFRREDLANVIGLPGFVTDMDLNEIEWS